MVDDKNNYWQNRNTHKKETFYKISFSVIRWMRINLSKYWITVWKEKKREFLINTAFILGFFFLFSSLQSKIRMSNISS